MSNFDFKASEMISGWWIVPALALAAFLAWPKIIWSLWWLIDLLFFGGVVMEN